MADNNLSAIKRSTALINDNFAGRNLIFPERFVSVGQIDIFITHFRHILCGANECISFFFCKM